MARRKLLLVDEDGEDASVLRSAFEGDGYEMVEARSGLRALSRLEADNPHLLLIGWMLRDMSGLDLCQRLRREPRSASLPIIMLTDDCDALARVRGLEAGADDFVTRPFSVIELLARARAVVRRSPRLASATLLAHGDVQMDLERHKVWRAGRPVALAPTEYRLLRHLLEHPGRVFSRIGLLDAIWGPGATVDPRTVDVHIRRLRNALNLDECPDIIRTVRSAGYSLDDTITS